MKKVLYFVCVVSVFCARDGFCSLRPRSSYSLRSQTQLSDANSAKVQEPERKREKEEEPVAVASEVVDVKISPELRQVMSYTKKRYEDAFHFGGNIHEVGDIIFGFKPGRVGDPINHNLERNNAQLVLGYLRNLVNERKEPSEQDWKDVQREMRRCWRGANRLRKLCELSEALNVRSTCVGGGNRWSDGEMKILMAGAELGPEARSLINAGVIQTLKGKISRSDIITCYGYSASEDPVRINKFPLPEELAILPKEKNEYGVEEIIISPEQREALLPLILSYRIRGRYSKLDDSEAKALAEVVSKLPKQIKQLEEKASIRTSLAYYYKDYFFKLLNCKISGFDDEFNNGGDSSYYATLRPLIVLAWKFAKSVNKAEEFSISLLENIGLNRGEACYPGFRNRALIWLCSQFLLLSEGISNTEYEELGKKYQKEYESGPVAK